MVQTLADLKSLHLHIGNDFAQAINFIRENGEQIANEKWWYNGYLMYMDPADAGYSATIIHDTTVYNGAWHLTCKDGSKNNQDVETCPTASVDGKRYTANDYKKAVEDANKREQAVVPTMEVPTSIIDNIIKYCETEAIYDKLGRYGDFYYKLKNLRK